MTSVTAQLAHVLATPSPFFPFSSFQYDRLRRASELFSILCPVIIGLSFKKMAECVEISTFEMVKECFIDSYIDEIPSNAASQTTPAPSKLKETSSQTYMKDEESESSEYQSLKEESSKDESQNLGSHDSAGNSEDQNRNLGSDDSAGNPKDQNRNLGSDENAHNYDLKKWQMAKWLIAVSITVPLGCAIGFVVVVVN